MCVRANTVRCARRHLGNIILKKRVKSKKRVFLSLASSPTREPFARCRVAAGIVALEDGRPTTATARPGGRLRLLRGDTCQKQEHLYLFILSPSPCSAFCNAVRWPVRRLMKINPPARAARSHLISTRQNNKKVACRGSESAFHVVGGR